MSYQANRKPAFRGRQPPARPLINQNKSRSSPFNGLDQAAKKRKIASEPRTPEAKGQDCKIQVVVRCRGFADDDEGRNSPGILLPAGSTTEIHCRTGDDERSMPKVYTFDHVYGPSASQRTIFENVAAPIVDQVLEGYSCTIFAYGQTGTGKTHTIEGKLNDVHMIPVGDAGIIPRVLFRLFESLNALPSPHEYSVKLSMLEVYNEEVFDLLALQDSVAPMDKLDLKMGPDNILKIDKLKEMLILTPEDGINYLKQGSKQRQKTATRLNSSSSRSHCIMTLLVKQSIPSEGGTVKRVGKINLVDLAGSEDIGRSGAVDQQAKEAGKINQSLLALGKIISLLYKNKVNNTDEKPLYRDSKLTRILQDSLGGGTRTCIIATISMAYINMKETLSTLKYANQAKSITNQVKTIVPKSPFVLYEEYREEASRLKVELKMVQDMDGIKLSTEEYLKLKQNESTLSDRLKKIEEKYHILHSENTELKEISLRKSNDLAKIQGDLAATEKKLEESQRDIESLETQLAHANELNQAYSKNEKQLDSAARKLFLAAQQRDSYISLLKASLDQAEESQRRSKEAISRMMQGLTNEIYTQKTYFDDFSRELTLQKNSFLKLVEVAKEKISSDISTAINELGEHVVESHKALASIQCQDDHNLSQFKDQLEKSRKESDMSVSSISSEICKVIDRMEQFKADCDFNSEKHQSKLNTLQSEFSSWARKECEDVKNSAQDQTEELAVSHDKYTKLQEGVYSQLKRQLDEVTSWTEAAKSDFELEKKDFVEGVQALASRFTLFGQQKFGKLSAKHTEQLESHTRHLGQLDQQSKEVALDAKSKIISNAEHYSKAIQQASLINTNLFDAAQGYHINMRQNITDFAVEDLSPPCKGIVDLAMQLKSEDDSMLTSLLDTHHSSRTNSLAQLLSLNERLPSTVKRCARQIQASTDESLNQTAQAYGSQSTQTRKDLEMIRSHSNNACKTLEEFPVHDLNPEATDDIMPHLEEYPSTWSLIGSKPFVPNHDSPNTPSRTDAIRSNKATRSAKRNGSLNYRPSQ
ncbi:Kinesin- protein 11 [Entomophthora muscae]|uniref:Kinesin- protein 11 n=1 Tax=Entomophthora muscae TaxID=34485 RepID=A0ACC2UAH7_9FUNG|nr:Kinesin- protein 11 [Entomophthora muscae]